MTKTKKTIENKTGISIQAPPDKVWEVLADLDGYTTWNPLFVKARGKLAEGETLQIKARFPVRMFCGAPMSRNWKSRVTKVLPNNTLEWFTPALMNGFLDGTHFFQLTASSDGQTTEFIQGERYEGWGTGLFSGFGTVEDARAGFAAMNRALKLEVLRRVSEGELVAADDGTVVACFQEKGDGKDGKASSVADEEAEEGKAEAEADEADEAENDAEDEDEGDEPSATTISSKAATAVIDRKATVAGSSAEDDEAVTIEVVGTRDAAAAAASRTDSSEDTKKNGGDDDDKNDCDNDAAIQDLDISDRQAVEAAKSAAAAGSTDTTAAPSSPPSQGHRKRRSLVERLSLFSNQSGSTPTSVQPSGLHSTTEEDGGQATDGAHGQTRTKTGGDDDDDDGEHRKTDKVEILQQPQQQPPPPSQAQTQAQPPQLPQQQPPQLLQLHFDGDSTEESKVNKADPKPFQLGLDLSLGGGLDFTF